MITASPLAPLVSCVMVTCDRPEWALHSVELFLKQDYANRELVIVEDGKPALANLLPDDRRIRLISTGGRASVGELRNRACEQARGEIIIGWDDDDWYGLNRITRQVAPILEGRADVTGLVGFGWLDVNTWRAWEVVPQQQARLLFHRMGCGTAAFRARLFDSGIRYPDQNLAEDVGFLGKLLAAGARLEAVEARDIFVYIRHGRNTWQLECGRFGGAHCWVRSILPEIPPDDLTFLHARAGAQSGELISCLMPTADRRAFVAQSIAYFQRQDHVNSELVIVDDGVHPVRDLAEGVPGVVYHRLERRMVLGGKRNLAVKLARGDVLAHWDDDDWYAPDRLTVQLTQLQTTRAEITGLSTVPYYAPATRRAWSYRWPSTRRPWVSGNSLMFTRSVWKSNPFPEAAIGEDTRFIWRAPTGRVAPTQEPIAVGIVHPRNTVRKSGAGAYWAPQPPETVEDILGDDRDFYLAPGVPAALGAR